MSCRLDHNLNSTAKISKKSPGSNYTADPARAKQSSTDDLPVRVVHATAPFNYLVYRVFHLCA